MIFAVPSKGRPFEVKTQKILPSCIVYVPESEVVDYRKAGVQNVVAVPGSVKGITATRNWILDNTEERHVVMVDDDVKAQGYFKLHKFNAQQKKLTEADWIREARKIFDITEDLKYRIWGVATDGALRSDYPWRPFLFKSYVTASFMGILNDGRTRFDESFPVKEDYELCLRCLRDDGGIVAARYLYWSNSHWTDAGGCASYRTQLMELRAIKKLKDMYPGLIRRIKRGGSRYSIELDF